MLILNTRENIQFSSSSQKSRPIRLLQMYFVKYITKNGNHNQILCQNLDNATEIFKKLTLAYGY